jgi:hypothetical protein
VGIEYESITARLRSGLTLTPLDRICFPVCISPPTHIVANNGHSHDLPALQPCAYVVSSVDNDDSHVGWVIGIGVGVVPDHDA